MLAGANHRDVNMNSNEWLFKKEEKLCGWKIRSIVCLWETISVRGVGGQTKCSGTPPWLLGIWPQNISVNAVRQMRLASERCLPRAEWHFLETIWDCSDIENISLPPDTLQFCGPFSFSVSPSFPPSPALSLSLLISLVLSAAVTAFCLFILLQVKRLDKVPKAWWHYTRKWNGWKCEWFQQKIMITDRKDRRYLVHFLKNGESCSCFVCVTPI